MRRKAIGVGAGAWLDDLPLLLASLEQEWGIAVGDVMRSKRRADSSSSTRTACSPNPNTTWVSSCARIHSKATRMNGHDGLQRTLASMPPASGIGGVVERVSTGLLGTNVGLQPVGRQMLAVADRVAGDG